MPSSRQRTKKLNPRTATSPNQIRRGDAKEFAGAVHAGIVDVLWRKGNFLLVSGRKRSSVDLVSKPDTSHMEIIFDCPHCGQELSVDRTGAGAEIKCPTCAETITIP